MRNIYPKTSLTHKILWLGLFLFTPLVLPAAAACEAQRIVSTAPSITEVLFDLGLGKKIVGVTKYCDYPQEARGIPKIGGYLDISFEKILQLRPTLIVHLEEQQNLATSFSRLGIKTVAVNHKSFQGVLESIERIGQAGVVEKAAQELIQELNSRLAQTSVTLPDNSKRPRVLISVGADKNGNFSNQYTVAGKGTFYNEALELAGGRNVVTSASPQYPLLSAEGIYALDPDIILEIVPTLDGILPDTLQLKKNWQQLTSLRAVQNERVIVLTQDYLVRPSPRFWMIVETIAEAITR